MTKSFANADGGDIVLGIEDDGRIVGVDNNPKHLNELLRAPLDYCVPSINVEVEYVACKDESAGNPAPEYKLYDFMLKVKLSSAYRETFSEEINNGIKDGGQTGGQRGGQTDGNSSIDAVLNAIIANPTVTRAKLSEITEIAPSAVQKCINKLKKQKIIARYGGDFGGHWKILRRDR
ncbi:RNA-binding domain-containing protein [Fibrobacter sp.]|uniref:RNA-binding domain-containing protein n=1 Tax=Fibrobacter sp. TaxID=35828 RepID=UPI00386B4722